MATVGNPEDELLQQMVLADGLYRSVPVLWPDEPFDEDVFLRRSSSSSEEHRHHHHHRRRDLDQARLHHGYFERRLIAQERHSFLTPDRCSNGQATSTPNLAFPRDPLFESSEVRPTDKDAPRWKKEWLRRKKGAGQSGIARSSSDEGLSSSQNTLRTRGPQREESGIFEPICRRRESARGSDETIITRVRSEGSVHALEAPGSKPRRSQSINNGASAARGGVHPRRSSESQPVVGGLTAYYHLMRARFPNVGGYSQGGSHTKGLTERPNYINRCSSADNPPTAQCPELLRSASVRVPYPRAALQRPVAVWECRIPTQALLRIPTRRVPSGW